MPSKTYALERGGPERVEVAWEGAFKEVSISFDGTAVGSFAGAELEVPQTLDLADGSRLSIALEKYGPLPELRISRNGEALPGTSGDPQTQLDAAVTMLYLVAGLNALLGIAAALGNIGFLLSMGIGWGSVVAGAIYAGLATMVKRRITPALAIAVGLFILDGLYAFVAAAGANASPPVGALITRTFLLLPMLRGFSAIRELNKPRRTPPRAPVRRAAPVLQKTATAGAPVASASASRPPSPSTNAAAKTLTGEAEKRRLALSEKTSASTTNLSGRRVDVQGPTGVDAARKALRFIAHKVEIGESGLHVTLPNGARRDIDYGTVGRIAARQLPPDPPWDGAVFVDIVPSAAVGEPVRVFATTTVNYAAIPGTGSTSRLENTRRLAAFLREQCRTAQVDEGTAEFIRGPKVPPRFVNMTQFLEYDSALTGVDQ